MFDSSINALTQEFSEEMKKEFEMSMVGELNYFLGLQVKQRKDGIFISQEKYVKNIVKRFGLDLKKHASTLMSSSTKLSSNLAGVEVNPTLYRSIISSLLYLTASRADVSFNVRVCARFQVALKESHMMVVKRIIWYVNGTSDYGIWYSKDSNDCLASYLDADWAVCVDDKKKHIGRMFLSWKQFGVMDEQEEKLSVIIDF